ncbi:MAG: YjgP/YjgQ family permease [Bacteroidetes bacterium]|nr:YjgP/YjgQ family permease [Bacteroidota bacterium]
MKKIYLFVIKLYLGPLVMTFFIAMFILLMQFLWKYIDDFVGKGLEWYIIVKLMFYVSVTFVPMALPLAILLSSLMTFGNLGEKYELTAIKASGISLRIIMKPLIMISIIISGIAFYFSNNVMPYANLKFKTLLYDVQSKKPAVNIQEGMYYDGIDGFIIKIGKKDKDGKTLHNIMIYDHTERSGNSKLTIAKSGKMELTSDNRFLFFTLYDGNNYNENLNTYENMQTRPMIRSSFKQEFRRFDLSAFAYSKTNENLFKNHFQMLNLKQLTQTEDTLKIGLKNKKTEFYKNSMNRFQFLTSLYDTTTKFKKDTTLNLKNNILSSFEASKRNTLLETALQSARAAKNEIDYWSIDFKDNEEYIRRYDIEWQRKFTLSIACLILFFIGAPLGAIIRKGGFGLPVVMSVLFFVIFHIISMIGEKSAREGILGAFQGMWLSSLIFLPIGIILTFKATTDSPLFDSDVWARVIKKLIRRN